MSSPSRYDAASPLTLSADDGRTVPYLRRRFLPRPATMTASSHFVVRAGQRHDLIAALALDDPELSWLLADANAAARPSELARPGRVIVIPGVMAGEHTHGL
jgi:hypothetical protein